MFYNCTLSLEPKDEEVLPDEVTIGSLLFDVLAHTGDHSSQFPFRVITLAIEQAGTEDPS